LLAEQESSRRTDQAVPVASQRATAMACREGPSSSLPTPSESLEAACRSRRQPRQATQAPGCGGPALSSGNPTADVAFRSEFQSQMAFWGLQGVSFAFLNDCDSPNAYANPQDRSILFGITLAQKLLTLLSAHGKEFQRPLFIHRSRLLNGRLELQQPQPSWNPAPRGAAVLAGGKVANEYVSGAIPRTYPAIRQRFAQELAFIL